MTGVGAHYQVMTTVDSPTRAEAIASAVLKQRLAACVQILGPMDSRYWWKGKLEQAEEWLCTMKTHESALDRLINLVRAEHPYETPEITAVRLESGDRDYLDWITSEVTTNRPED